VSTQKKENLLKDIEVKADKKRDPFYRIKSRHYVHRNKKHYKRKSKHRTSTL
jgi:hypothetical protein